MNFFFLSFRMELKRRLRTAGSLVLLALVLILSVCAAILPGSREAVVRVGLVLPRSGAALEELLMERCSELVVFLPTDEETLNRKVLTGQWDCGLIAHEDFAEKLESLDLRNLFTMKISPASTVYPLIQETVAACVTELTGPEIARSYLREQGLETGDLDERLVALEQSSQRVDVVLETLDGARLRAPDLTSTGVERILRGLVGVLALLWGLYLTGDLGRFLQSGSGLRLRSLRGVTGLLLPRLCAALLPVLVWGMGLLLALGGWKASVAFGAFLTVVLGLGLVISRFEPLWKSVAVLMPFLALGCLLLEPVLLDVHSLFPQAGRWLGWLPVTLYCRACDGDFFALPVLLLQGAALTAVSLLLDGFVRKPRHP